MWAIGLGLRLGLGLLGLGFGGWGHHDWADRHVERGHEGAAVAARHNQAVARALEGGHRTPAERGGAGGEG